MILRSVLNLNNSKLWQWMRCGRITASIFRTCCHAKLDHPSKSLVRKIIFLEESDVSCVNTNWGKDNEIYAVSEIFKNFKTCHVNLKKRNCGIFIKKEFPFLGASPDAIFECDCHGSFPIEVKCPYTLRYTQNCKSDLLSMNNSFLICKNGTFELKNVHAYYLSGFLFSKSIFL